jgi:hypothetical protein
VTGGPSSAVNPIGVKAALGEIEKDVGDNAKTDRS